MPDIPNPPPPKKIISTAIGRIDDVSPRGKKYLKPDRKTGQLDINDHGYKALRKNYLAYIQTFKPNVGITTAEVKKQKSVLDLVKVIFTKLGKTTTDDKIEEYILIETGNDS